MDLGVFQQNWSHVLPATPYKKTCMIVMKLDGVFYCGVFIVKNVCQGKCRNDAVGLWHWSDALSATYPQRITGL